MNALRRFKYRHVLRIGARDLLGDADLSVTTEELARDLDSVRRAVRRAIGRTPECERDRRSVDTHFAER